MSIVDYEPSEKGKKRVIELKEAVAELIRTHSMQMPKGKDQERFEAKMEMACMFGVKAILYHKDHRIGSVEY